MSALLLSIYEENYKSCNFLLDLQADPNICNNDGEYPIHLAAIKMN